MAGQTKLLLIWALRNALHNILRDTGMLMDVLVTWPQRCISNINKLLSLGRLDAWQQQGKEKGWSLTLLRVCALCRWGVCLLRVCCYRQNNLHTAPESNALHHSSRCLALRMVILGLCVAARPWKPISRSSRQLFCLSFFMQFGTL